MRIGRRTFLGGTGALIGCSIGASGWAATTPPVTREQWDAIIEQDLGPDGFDCVLSPQAQEGPFYNEASPHRGDITEGHKGQPLRLELIVGGLTAADRCSPLQGAVVDIWQANALGQYSNVGENIQQEATAGQTFLRGHQITDAHGHVAFDTIVPGWEAVAIAGPLGYAVRTTHIHVKIYHGWQVFDTQLYFPDALLDALYADVEPYRSCSVLSVPGSDRQLSRIRNMDDQGFVLSQSSPISVERKAGKLIASAALGTLSMGNRGVPTLFRS